MHRGAEDVRSDLARKALACDCSVRGWLILVLAALLAPSALPESRLLRLEDRPSRLPLFGTVLAGADIRALRALLYGTLLGISGGAAAAANSIVWPDYFGVDALGAVKGVVNATRNGATAVGPPLTAFLVTADGSFAPALIVLRSVSLVVGITAWFLAPPKHPDSGQPPVGRRGHEESGDHP